MKGLVGLLVALLTAGGIYFFYMKSMPTADAGTAPTQAISLTGVRMVKTSETGSSGSSC